MHLFKFLCQPSLQPTNVITHDGQAQVWQKEAYQKGGSKGTTWWSSWGGAWYHEPKVAAIMVRLNLYIYIWWKRFQLHFLDQDLLRQCQSCQDWRAVTYLTIRSHCITVQLELQTACLLVVDGCLKHGQQWHTSPLQHDDSKPNVVIKFSMEALTAWWLLAA